MFKYCLLFCLYSNIVFLNKIFRNMHSIMLRKGPRGGEEVWQQARQRWPGLRL